ncbi:MAG: hypothetical protein HGA45_14895, partial [Chloroflexales bacterium]|nr:hypothetical protein [Chloroflexales bacterium]
MATSMNAPRTPSRTRPAGRRVLHRIGTGLIVALVLIVVLGLAGAIYESAAEAADLRAYPPPGQLVDVGGYRLHLNCTGTGSPTVVIESGWGDMSASWGWVQPEVAKTTRICTYDRAGMGWSGMCQVPLNRSLGEIRCVADLHAQHLRVSLADGAPGVKGPLRG